jgi:hypothetical protein
MAVAGARLSLPGVSLQTLADALNVSGYLAADGHQCGIYTNAALGAAWVDLAAPDFLNLADADPLLGPQPCGPANLDFTELVVWNDSVNIVYFVLRVHYVSPPPASVPEDPTLTAFPVPAGGVVTISSSLVNSGASVDTIALIASGAGSAVRVFARFADRT